MSGSPGGKSVGRVSIRVLPDSSKFKQDLKKVLDRIEATVDVAIPVIIDEKAKARFRRDIQKLVKDAQNDKVNLAVKADTIVARAELARVARTRTATINAKVSKASIAVAAATLTRLSGLRVTGDVSKDVLEWASNLDKTIPKIALVSSWIGSLISIILSATSGLFGIGAGLASLAPGLLVIPGLFAGAVLSLGVFIVALRDAKTQLAALSPVVSELRRVISDNFWAQAKNPIINLVRGLLPQLRNSFGETSKSIGGFVASMSNSLGKAFAGGRFEDIFAGLPRTFAVLSTGTDAFAGTISSLGLVAAKYVPQIAQWFVDASFKFDSFLTRAANNGQLDQWMTRTKQGLAQVGRSFVATGRILNGIWNAAVDGGSKGLGGFADSLERLAKTVNGPKFQGFMKSLFQGASQGSGAVAHGLDQVSGMLFILRGQVSLFLADAGSAIDALLSGISRQLDNPIIRDGLTNALNGILDGVQQFSSKLDLTKGLGSLLTLIGSAAPGFGSILAGGLNILGDALGPIADALSGKDGGISLADLLSSTAGELKKLGPDAKAAAKAVAPLVTDIVQLADSAVKFTGSGLDKFFSGFSSNSQKQLDKATKGNDPLENFMTSLGQSARNQLGIIQEVFDPDAWGQFVDPAALARFDKKVKDGVYGAFAQDWSNLVTPIDDFLDKGIQGIFDPKKWQQGWSQITDWWNSLWASGSGSGANGVGGGNPFALPDISGLGSSLMTSLLTGLQQSFPQVGQFFIDLPTQISTLTAGAITWLQQAGQNAIQGLLNGFVAQFPGARAWLDGIQAQVSAFKSDPAGWLYSVGTNIVQGLINGIAAWVPKLIAKAGDMADQVVKKIKKQFGIQSPSVVMRRDVVGNLAKGALLGFDDHQASIEARAASFMNPASFKTSLPDFSGLGAALAGGAGSGSGPTFEVNAHHQFDYTRLAREIVRILKWGGTA